MIETDDAKSRIDIRKFVNGCQRIPARAKIGELMMRLELAEDLIEKRGFTDEWKRRAR